MAFRRVSRRGFETANTNMLTQLRALQAAANAGDQAAFGAAFQQTGATCGACHRPYRGPARYAFPALNAFLGARFSKRSE